MAANALDLDGVFTRRAKRPHVESVTSGQSGEERRGEEVLGAEMQPSCWINEEVRLLKAQDSTANQATSETPVWMGVANGLERPVLI